MSNPELPALDRLGYAIDVSRITAMDISSVDSSVLSIRRLITYDQDDTRDVVIGGVTYKVPRSISIIDDNAVVQGSFITFADGTEASTAFRNDSALSMRYFALSGTTSATYASEKSFLRSNQYAFYAYTKNQYSARLRDYADDLNVKALEGGVGGLTKPFNGANSSILKQYKDFFERYGSHIIVNANYGARYPLKVWASNKTDAVNNRFATSVKAIFSGIPSGGDYDITVKSETQYKTFQEYMQHLVTVSGGDQALAAKLGNISATYQEYSDWTNSTLSPTAGVSLLSFQVTEVWTLMKLTTSNILLDYADPLYDAFMYIVSHPALHKTPVTLDIQSDWAEFNLLTPSAVIFPDPANPYPPSNTVASETRVQWGKEHSHAYEKKTLRFFVVNDGSPIDFSTSHGSLAGGGSPTGRAEVIMEGESFLNSRITDDVWNTQWFYRAAVAKDPEPMGLKTRYEAHSWDDLLDEYRQRIAH